jgi:hypothetical protein
MSLEFRFAIVSDPHIALPHTVWDHPSRFHLVEVSIPALEWVFCELEQFDLDFLLLPGDLTQHGEPENHAWLANRLEKLPYPAYVVPGNHDVIQAKASEGAIGLPEFPHYYQNFGYTDPTLPYYRRQILPGVQLIGLNSNAFDAEGQQFPVGRMDTAQLRWLEEELTQVGTDLVLVMIHHNVLEHLPGQTQHGMGRRYMLENAPDLLTLLEQAGVRLLFTGHLHVQDVAQQGEFFEITTGSLVSYPHPYRVLHYHQEPEGQAQLKIESGRVTSVPGWDDLLHFSREWMGDRSFPFMLKLLTQPPLNLPTVEAEAFAPHLRYFWAGIAEGDAHFDFPDLPPAVRRYLHRFSALDEFGQPQPIDNHTVLTMAKADVLGKAFAMQFSEGYRP